jgi:hypothetical protein
VTSDLSRNEVREEGNLLIEAVALLVQRQRETESWVAEQIWQAEERAAATDRRNAELEARLEGIEGHLARLVHELEPQPGDAVANERLARLREQVEGLKLEPTVREPESARTVVAEPRPVVTRSPDPVPAAEPRPGAPAEPRHERRPAAAQAVSSRGSSVSFLDVLGPNPQDRWGVVLIGAGVLAFVFAVLTQLRFS